MHPVKMFSEPQDGQAMNRIMVEKYGLHITWLKAANGGILATGSGIRD